MAANQLAPARMDGAIKTEAAAVLMDWTGQFKRDCKREGKGQHRCHYNIRISTIAGVGRHWSVSRQFAPDARQPGLLIAR